jgi:biotin transport system substrate-specific component
MEAIKKIEINNQIKNILITVLGTLILTLSAKIQTPLAQVPVTMQTFAVLFLGMAFGYKIATATVILYLIEGAFGFPVFAKGGGIIYFQGPTTGYLFGFIIGAFFSGYFKIGSGALSTFIKLLFAVSFIYIFGLIWLWANLNFYSGKDLSFFQVFEIGAKPFLIIETYKLLILTVLSEKIFKVRKFI